MTRGQVRDDALCARPFAPAGGGRVLNAAVAHAGRRQLEPRRPEALADEREELPTRRRRLGGARSSHDGPKPSPTSVKSCPPAVDASLAPGPQTDAMEGGM